VSGLPIPAIEVPREGTTTKTFSRARRGDSPLYLQTEGGYRSKKNGGTARDTAAPNLKQGGFFNRT